MDERARKLDGEDLLGATDLHRPPVASPLDVAPGLPLGELLLAGELTRRFGHAQTGGQKRHSRVYSLG